MKVKISFGESSQKDFIEHFSLKKIWAFYKNKINGRSHEVDRQKCGN